MIIICPHCNFSKDIAEGDIPENISRVNCPRCGQSFPFSRPASRPEPPPIPQVQAAARPAAGYAGFWLRFVALVIDSIVLGLVHMAGAILFGLTGALASRGFGNEPDMAFVFLIIGFNTAIDWAYFVVFTGACGQTLGKMALRIKVVRTDGGDIGYGGAFLREVPGKILSGLMTLGIGYLMVAFTQRKQGLHDMIAGSYVIKL